MIRTAFFRYVLKHNWRAIQIQINDYVLDNITSLSSDSSLHFDNIKNED